MNEKAAYLIFDCFPLEGSDAFSNFSGAVAGCWIAETEIENAERLARNRLTREGWSIARVLQRGTVGRKDYPDGADGRDFFEQSLLDGFVAHFHTRQRTCLHGDGTATIGSVDGLVEATEQLGRQGARSWFSRGAQQWARGTLPGGDAFVPLWATEDSALVWRGRWPGHVLRTISEEKLARGELFDALDAKLAWAAIGIGGETLAMCHPRWVHRVIQRVLTR